MIKITINDKEVASVAEVAKHYKTNRPRIYRLLAQNDQIKTIKFNNVTYILCETLPKSI